MKRIVPAIAAFVALSLVAPQAARRTTLDIFFIDVEGGQSTLIVTPTGESLLVDGGFPGDGKFDSISANPRDARDANRVVAAARDAGITRIDDLLVTHFHADHFGAIPELAELMPIRTFVDHDTVPAEAERNVPGTLAAFARYEKVRARGRHVIAKVGSRLPLSGVVAEIVSSAGTTLSRPLPGAGEPNPACAAAPLPAQEPNENPRSTGFYLKFGRFTFLDPGDLTGQPLDALACPQDKIGAVDVYLVAHHGGLDAADPATLAAFRPQAAIINNGARKGGTPEMLAVLQKASGVDVYQLHRSIAAAGANAADERLANLDDSAAHWIKVSARSDGTFTVTNGRTGAAKQYSPRRRDGRSLTPND